MREANEKLMRLRALQKSTDLSLQQLINKAYQILGNPMILYDIDWKILAYAENVVTDDPLWNNHINEKVNSNRDVLVNEGFIDIMTRPDRVVLLSSEKVKYDRFFGKVYNEDGVLIAGISVVASNKAFEDDDLIAVEAICKLFSKEICKIPYYQNYPQMKLDSYISMLIDGDIKDKLYLSGYMAFVYEGLKDNLYLAVADTSRCDPMHAKLDYYRGLFKRTRPSFKYSVYSNYIIIIMSTDEALFYPKRILNRLNRIFREDNIKVGISSRFENLYELKQYYTEAVEALDSGLKRDSNQWLFCKIDMNRGIGDRKGWI